MRARRLVGVILAAAAAAALVACRERAAPRPAPRAPLAAPLAAPAAPAPAAAPDLLVFRDTAARVRPHAQAPVAMTLRRESRVRWASEDSDDGAGGRWRKVVWPGGEGWAPAADLIRADILTELRAVQRRLAAGNADAVEGTYGGVDIGWVKGCKINCSPDGHRALLTAKAPGEPETPPMFVTADGGLRDIWPAWWPAATWSPDSRRLGDAYGNAAVRRLRFFDVATGRVVDVGSVFAQDFEFAGPFLVYLTAEAPAAPPGDFPADQLVPALVAYNIETGKTVRVLEPALMPWYRRPDGWLEVRLAPAPGIGDVPPEVTTSLIYYRYVWAYAPCWPAPPGGG